MTPVKKDPRFTISAKWNRRESGQIDYDVALMDKRSVVKHWPGVGSNLFEMRVVLEKAAKLRKRALKTNRT